MGSFTPHITRDHLLADKKTSSIIESTSVTDVPEYTGKNNPKFDIGGTPKSADDIVNFFYDTKLKQNKSFNFSTSKYPISSTSLDNLIGKINESVFISDKGTAKTIFDKSTVKYNRFKVADPNKELQKGFAHVFFVRPHCNILKEGDTSKLADRVASNELFKYAMNTCPSVLKELVQYNGQQHDFMLGLSNAICSFSLQDEYIETDSYGKTFTGYKIAYGKNNIDSKSAGEFNITINDNRNLHLYLLHRVWVEYINGVYRGELAPKESNIINKIIDYAASCYYFITAEDGETILFWTKYFGVFPSNIPSSQYSWGEGNIITKTNLDVAYKFSFKEDFNPYTIIEFNYNARIDKTGVSHVPVFDSTLNHVGATWVGAPFIEAVVDKDSGLYEYKLRFRKK